MYFLKIWGWNIHNCLKTYHNYMSPLHSYLKNGLIAARLATLGALGADGKVVHAFFTSLFDFTLFFSPNCLITCFHFLQGWTGKSSLVHASRKSTERKWLLEGTTIKSVGFQTVRLKPTEVFGCFPAVFDPAIQTFMAQFWNAVEYSTTQSPTITHIRPTSFTVGTRQMFCLSAFPLAKLLSSSQCLKEKDFFLPSPSWSPKNAKLVSDFSCVKGAAWFSLLTIMW